MLCCDWLSYQLFLQVYGPDDSVVSYCKDEEEEEGQLSITHLPYSSVVEDRLPPIRKPVHQDVVVPAHMHVTHARVSVIQVLRIMAVMGTGCHKNQSRGNTSQMRDNES